MSLPDGTAHTPLTRKVSVLRVPCGDAVRIRSEGEAEGTKIRALGQARAQETITKTLTPEYLRYKLYDSPNTKMVSVPDILQVPILLNPNDGRGTGGPVTTMHAEELLTGVGR